MESLLTVGAITRIAMDVARELLAPVRVIGTVLGGRGSQYAEILMRVEGQHEPWRFQLGVFRHVGVAALRVQIAEQLHRHLAAGSA